MMEKLKSQYHRAKTITLIMDKYIIHKSKKDSELAKEKSKVRSAVSASLLSMGEQNREALVCLTRNDYAESSKQNNVETSEASTPFYEQCISVSRWRSWNTESGAQLESVI